MNYELEQLENIKIAYQNLIRENFEFKAKSCQSCETKGICCLDAHFVNVHITELEAVAIIEKLKSLNKLDEVLQRNEETISLYNLSENGDTFAQTFSCPLFEQNVGCLVHDEAKPIPCITHACYENQEDLPPQFLQSRAEKKIEELNGENVKWLPLPIWLKKVK
ncbi:MAG: hypothetical protein MUC29_09210 [Pyrinomonadaceae bacterium]|jgi:hypothetical protein|nr:hypothetical protein [Pyrinomonadaceae bacterium]